jgi:hypothetical protein
MISAEATAGTASTVVAQAASVMRACFGFTAGSNPSE